MFFSVAAVYPM